MCVKSPPPHLHFNTCILRLVTDSQQPSQRHLGGPIKLSGVGRVTCSHPISSNIWLPVSHRAARRHTYFWFLTRPTKHASCSQVRSCQLKASQMHSHLFCGLWPTYTWARGCQTVLSLNKNQCVSASSPWHWLGLPFVRKKNCSQKWALIHHISSWSHFSWLEEIKMVSKS